MERTRLEDFEKLFKNDKVTEMLSILSKESYIRTVNYHNTPYYRRDEFERQLEFFSRYFSPVTFADIEDLYTGKGWNKDKPGIILSLFEGYRNNYDVYLPLLEQYGFTGWFFIISEFLNIPIREQRQYAKDHDIDPCEAGEDGYGDGRIALNWEELKEISKKHLVICHTKTHYRITQDTCEDIMYDEIVNSKLEIQKHIDRKVDMFCWLGGERFGFNKKASELIKEAEYSYVFSGGKIEKIK